MWPEEISYCNPAQVLIPLAPLPEFHSPTFWSRKRGTEKIPIREKL